MRLHFARARAMRRLICRFLPVKSVGTSANTQSWSGRPKAVDQRALSTESGAPHIAVIGGGLGGSSAAQSLAKLGSRVSVFDMGFRGPGGRSGKHLALLIACHTETGSTAAFCPTVYFAASMLFCPIVGCRASAGIGLCSFFFSKCRWASVHKKIRRPAF